MTTVVILQPMLFPWVGVFEQIRLADVYVHYDDVQFSRGGFMNRVQVKTVAGPRWLTVPLAGLELGQQIRDVRVDERQEWRASRLSLLDQALRGTPCRSQALELARSVFARRDSALADLSIASIEACRGYLGLAPRTRFLRSSTLGVPGQGSARVLALVRRLGGSVYVSGRGGADYLDHEAFEAAGVRVEYMSYQRRPYPQLHGAFTPHVTILDLIANLGTEGLGCIVSGTVPWREFLAARGEGG